MKLRASVNNVFSSSLSLERNGEGAGHWLLTAVDSLRHGLLIVQMVKRLAYFSGGHVLHNQMNSTSSKCAAMTLIKDSCCDQQVQVWQWVSRAHHNALLDILSGAAGLGVTIGHKDDPR